MTSTFFNVATDAFFFAEKTTGSSSGYGWVCDVDGRRIGSLVVNNVSQEHGVISGDVNWQRLAIGTRVRIVPNHACMTAAGYSGYHVVQGTEVTGWWRRATGFR